MLVRCPARSNPQGVAECLGTFGLLAVMPVVSAFQKSPLAFTTLKAAVHPRGKVVPRFRPVVCAEGATRELSEESWGTYIIFRVTSMLSCGCAPLGAARRNRPSRRRRVECSAAAETSSAHSPLLAAVFGTGGRSRVSRKVLLDDPRAVVYATRVSYLVGHTTGLHLPAPSYILFERVVILGTPCPLSHFSLLPYSAYFVRVSPSDTKSLSLVLSAHSSRC